jgi:hypothetical protein
VRSNSRQVPGTFARIAMNTGSKCGLRATSTHSAASDQVARDHGGAEPGKRISRF